MSKSKTKLQSEQQSQMRQLAVDMLRLLIDQEGEIARIVDRRIEEMLLMHAREDQPTILNNQSI